MQYSTDATAAQTTANIGQARYGATGVSNVGFNGYIMGGGSSTSTYYTNTDKIFYAYDTISAAITAGALKVARFGLAGITNLNTGGYVAGGYSGGACSNTEYIVFSTDSNAAQTSANLSQSRYWLSGVANSGEFGYFIGGGTASYYKTADQLTFSTQATAALTTAQLTTGTSAVTGASGNSV